jgi:hypothetical protein
VSNPDSFINEVTEEVRRDRLFAMFRKYGWIGGLLVVAIVGGAAYSEWTKAQALARAEGFGDAMLDALDIGGADDRRAAMAARQREPSGSGASWRLAKIQHHVASFVQGLGKAVTDCLQELPEGCKRR